MTTTTIKQIRSLSEAAQQVLEGDDSDEILYTTDQGGTISVKYQGKTLFSGEAEMLETRDMFSFVQKVLGEYQGQKVESLEKEISDMETKGWTDMNMGQYGEKFKPEEQAYQKGSLRIVKKKGNTVTFGFKVKPKFKKYIKLKIK